MGLFDDNNKLHKDILHIYEKIDRTGELIAKRFEKMDVRVDSIDKSLVIYNEQLKVHIQGVEQARIENKLLRDYIDGEVNKLTKSMMPVTKHVSLVQNIAWFVVKSISVIAVSTGLLYTVMQIGGF